MYKQKSEKIWGTTKKVLIIYLIMRDIAKNEIKELMI